MWTGTSGTVHDYASDGKRFFTVSDTLPGTVTIVCPSGNDACLYSLFWTLVDVFRIKL